MIYSPQPADQSVTEHPLCRSLYLTVAVLGLASYGFSFGPVDDGEAIGWHVRFAVLAALFAAFGLLAKQRPHAQVIAALAAMGFVHALSTIMTEEAGWLLIVTVVFNGLQTVAAITALVLAPKAETPSAGYEAYINYYNQAVQQASAAPSETSQHGGYGQPSAQAAVPAQRTQRPPQYAEYADLVSQQREHRPASSPRAGRGLAVPAPGSPRVSPVQAPDAPAEDDLTRPLSAP